MSLLVFALLDLPTHLPVSPSQSSLHGSREDVRGEGSTASHRDVSPGSYGGFLCYFHEELIEGITVSRNFEASEGFLSVKVVTLSTGHTAGEEGISTVGLLITPALITPETITCRVGPASD